MHRGKNGIAWLFVASLSVWLAGCAGKPVATILGGQCQLPGVHTPVTDVQGKTSNDQDWVDKVNLGLVEGCGQPPPGPRDPTWDNPPPPTKRVAPAPVAQKKGFIRKSLGRVKASVFPRAAPLPAPRPVIEAEPVEVEPPQAEPAPTAVVPEERAPEPVPPRVVRPSDRVLKRPPAPSPAPPRAAPPPEPSFPCRHFGLC